MAPTVIIGQGATKPKMLGTGNFYGAPQFIDPEWGTTGDFHLQDISPAIDSGATIAGLTDDLEFFPRPYAGAYDIGCYE